MEKKYFVFSSAVRETWQVSFHLLSVSVLLYLFSHQTREAGETVAGFGHRTSLGSQLHYYFHRTSFQCFRKPFCCSEDFEGTNLSSLN